MIAAKPLLLMSAAYRLLENLIASKPKAVINSQFIDDLRDEVRLLNDTRGASEAVDVWLTSQREIRRLIEQGDPGEFLRWEPILRTMFVDRSPYIIEEFLYLRRHRMWSSRWLPALQESVVGRPYSFMLYPQTSSNLIHHAYHLCLFEDKTGQKVDTMRFVCEFGGGYGSMYRLFRSLGFTGRYVIFDLPLLAALQRFYLRAVGLTCTRYSDSSQPVTSHCATLSDPKELEAAAVPDDKGMFIATWSLCEAPLVVRQHFADLMQRCTSILLTYSEKFSGIDNVAYFAKLQREMAASHHWQKLPILHLPKNYYLLGTKVSSM